MKILSVAFLVVLPLSAFSGPERASTVDAPAALAWTAPLDHGGVTPEVGDACPPGFEPRRAILHRVDTNGDGIVCEKETPDGPIYVDNRFPEGDDVLL